jgi:hypothetical protein
LPEGDYLQAKRFSAKLVLNFSKTLFLLFNGIGGPRTTDWEEAFTLTFLDNPTAPIAGGMNVAQTSGFQALPINSAGLIDDAFHVSLQSSDVPEPASLLLLGTVFVGLGYKMLAARRV